jgi:hypothetical protein
VRWQRALGELERLTWPLEPLGKEPLAYAL